MLLRRGAIVPRVTHLSGLSGGAHTSIALHMGWNGTQQLAFWDDIFADCYAIYGNDWGPGGHLSSVMRAHYMRALPADIHKRGGWGGLLAAATRTTATAHVPDTAPTNRAPPSLTALPGAACSGGQAAHRHEPA
jgi:hypothetical protein